MIANHGNRLRLIRVEGCFDAKSTLVGEEHSPLEFLLPGLVAGIPIAVIALVVLLQITGGAAWLPVVRHG